MILNDSELAVVEAAETLAATLGDDANHTVAAAVMDAAGRIHTGVNVFHFTGGPCAELVALGVAAASQASPLVTMAAAGDEGRGIIPPCGRCRQVMLDLHPDMDVVVPSSSGLQVLPVRKLLPESYVHPDAAGQRMVRFHRRYFDAIASGTKTVTVRYDDPIEIGRALFVFEGDPSFRTLPGMVDGVATYQLDQLTAEQALLPEDASLDGLRAGLQSHYPQMPHDAEVSIVSFHVDADPERWTSATDPT